jgi:hypothetical protein
MIGEVTAETSAGLSWTHIETAGYRANGFYDSCWVPLVTYKAATMVDAADQTIPENMGRCLPFHASSAAGGEFDTGEGDYNFFVEHNLGPIHSLRDISIKVFVGSIKSDQTLKADGEWTSIHQSSATFGSPYNNANVPYGASHDFYDGTVNGAKGYLKELTAVARLSMYDSRFARVRLENPAAAGVGVTDPAGIAAQYIRVIIERTR